MPSAADENGLFLCQCNDPAKTLVPHFGECRKEVNMDTDCNDERYHTYLETQGICFGVSKDEDYDSCGDGFEGCEICAWAKYADSAEA